MSQNNTQLLIRLIVNDMHKHLEITFDVLAK